MILKEATVDKRLYLTPNRELVEEKSSDFESLFEEEYRKAKESGLKSGEKEGYARAAAELASMVKLVQRLSERLLEQKKQLLEQMKPEVIEFALAVCERVIRQELKEPAVFTKLIQTLLDQAINAFPEEKIKVFLAPQDLEILGKVDCDKSSFHADPLMCAGDCRIEAKSGILNADISNLLDDLKPC